MLDFIDIDIILATRLLVGVMVVVGVAVLWLVWKFFKGEC